MKPDRCIRSIPLARASQGWTWLAIMIATTLALLLAVGPRVALAHDIGVVEGRELELRSPRQGAVEDESSVLLSWLRDPRAADYTVFVSETSLDARSVEQLLADPAVASKTTQIASIRLQDVLRGDAGTTEYSWAVAARDRVSGEFILSQPSTFSAVKTFEGSAPTTYLIRETRRGTFEVEATVDGGSILLANDLRFDPVTEGEPQLPSALTARALREGETGSFLVQLDGPILPGEREQIAAAGGTIFAYVPNYTYVVRMPLEAKTAVQALPFVRWVGNYHPAYRISAQPQMNEPSGTRTLWVLLFPDAGLGNALTDIEAMGGTVLESTDSGRNKLIRVSIDMSQAPALAARNDVAWVEPYHPMIPHNADAQWVVQTHINGNRRVWNEGITGAGQIVHTSDSGIRTSHNAFRDGAISITSYGDYPTHRKVIAYQKAASVPNGVISFGDESINSYHGTHTAGSLMGNDAPWAANLNDGNALDARIYFHDAGGTSDGNIHTPGDLNILFQQAYDGNAAGGARISSNSWGLGSSAATNGLYDVGAMTADQFMWDHKDFLHFFSNGNASGSGTVTPPATNKNGVGAGGTRNGTSSTLIYSSTSRGPCDDGRRKPTICAPGQSVRSANGSGDTGYKLLSGTSMSSPTMAGATTLIRQYLTDGWYPSGAAVGANTFTPSGSLLKAMAIASTDNDMSGFNIPDNNVGWGRINVDNILYFPGDLRRLALIDDKDGLATGEFVEYEVNVTDTSVPLQIALAWTDKEGSPSAATQLVNDLDLTVTSPTATVYVGNVFSGGQSTTGGSADQVNVEEGVRRDVPTAGVWTIRVAASNAPFSPQPFGLVVSGGIGGNSGFVQLDKGTYGQDDMIEIRVEDLNAGSPISVAVSSDTETTPEVVSIAGSGGVFQGTIPTTAFSAAKAAADGKISLSHGDAITVAYTDASPAGTVTANAVADFNGPLITDVSSEGGSVSASIARTITWTTDVLATSQLFYGTTIALGSSTALDSALVGSHAHVVSNLAAKTTYFFDVESKDHGGNVTRDDNGGFHYRFTTDDQGDILVIIGDPTFEKDSLYAAGLEAKGWTYDILKGGTIIDPLVGDKTAGMRAYKTVWWQVGLEQYPPFENSTRDSISAYLDGGGRFAVSSHDVAWAFGDPSSGFYTNPRNSWMESDLHIQWDADPPTFSLIDGIAGDPISGDFTAGIAYVPHRDGAAGDEVSIVAGTGTGNYSWRNNDISPDDISVRWVNGVPNGNAADAFWGGTPTQTSVNCLEWSHMTDDAGRNAFLDSTIIWLIGHDHPDVVVTAPNGGETITTNSTNVTWTETSYAGGGLVADVYYSDDDGSSWTLAASDVSSPYNWDLSSLSNGALYRVRVEGTDAGTPPLVGTDQSNATFTIDRLGGDNRGPSVVAGSILSDPNPMNNTASSTLSATVTDVGKGSSDIAAAEWSQGVSPASAGSGTAMSGTFTSTTVDVSATVGAGVVAAGQRTFWVRAQDAAGNWGNASSLDVVVNGSATGVEGGSPLPQRYALERNSPNPFNPSTVIRYALPRETTVNLAVYNINGQVVRTLASGLQSAGFKSVMWDGLNDGGELVTSGVYFYRLHTNEFDESHKMVLVK